MYRLHWLILPLLVLGLTLSACDSAEPEAELGTIEGRVLAGNGETPVAGATVTMASAAVQRPAAGALLVQNAPSAVTDADGRFVLEGVPVGNQDLIARRGNFIANFSVNVLPNEVVMAPPLQLAPERALAFVRGGFDSMEIVVGEEGYEITEVQTSVFGTAGSMDDYGVLFLNCDSRLSESEEALNRTRAWVEAGGTLYISDLSGRTANRLIDGFESGSGGTSAQNITATIDFEDLRSFLNGQSEVEIRYNLSSWYRIRELPDTAYSLLSGTRQGEDEPESLAVSMPLGQGRIVFTTFHNTAVATEDQRALLRYFIYLG